MEAMEQRNDLQSSEAGLLQGTDLHPKAVSSIILK